TVQSSEQESVDRKNSATRMARRARRANTTASMLPWPRHALAPRGPPSSRVVCLASRCVCRGAEAEGGRGGGGPPRREEPAHDVVLLDARCGRGCRNIHRPLGDRREPKTRSLRARRMHAERQWAGPGRLLRPSVGGQRDRHAYELAAWRERDLGGDGGDD